MSDKKNLAHVVCQTIRGHCSECPSKVHSAYGAGTQMCVLLARQAIKEVRKFDRAKKK